MPTSLTFDEHQAAIGMAGARLVALATDAGMDARVPSCPGWTTDSLLAHQTMVHRWATAHVRGSDPAAVPTQTDIRRTVADLSGYYVQGLVELSDALRDAPADLVAMRFLNDAPSPRDFWARRQAHETTIHMVDALGASVGRVPRAVEAGIEPLLAADGIDELVRGFFTRGRCKLYDGVEYSVAVVARDADRRWVLHVAPSLTVGPDGGSDEEADVAATITGTAVEVYLTLWNRGAEAEITGRADVLERWRATQRVRWS